MMKRIIFIVAMLWSVAYGQSKVFIRGDSIVIQKVGGNGELIVENGTRNVTGGVLTNMGNGRTRFVVPSGGGLSGGNLGSSYRLYSPGSLGIKTLAGPNSVKIDSATSNTITAQLDGDQSAPGPYYNYGTNGSGTKGFYRGAALDTSERQDQYTIVYDDASGMLVFRPPYDTAGTGGLPAGNNTNVQINRNGAFAAAGSDSLSWVANGLTIKGRYMIDGVPVVYQPDQTSFLNSIFYGSLPASLSHTTGLTGQYNTGVGKLALNALTTGAANAGFGSRALQAVNTGINNTGVGDGAGITITSGGSNTAVGMAALATNSTSSNNTAIGMESLRAATSGNGTALGWRSLHETTSGADNTGVGVDAGYQNQSGSRNTWVGSGAGTGASANSNNNNTGVGYRAGFGTSTGSGNVFIGDSAGFNNTTGIRNLIVGTNISASAATASFEMNIGGLLKGTGMTATGTGNAGNLGIGITPTARLTLPAGTTAASTAPSKYTTGPLLTTIEAGAREYDNAHYVSNSALNRMPIEGIIFSNSTSVSNSTTTVTTLSTYTTKANTLNANEEKLKFEYEGTVDDASPIDLQVSFAGTTIGSFAPAGGGMSWHITGKIVRTGSSTATAYVQMTSNTTTVTNVIVKLTGLTFSNTNILLLTGQSDTGATDDIVKELAEIRWIGAPAN